jgi:CheY-like chemotaxis protein
MTTEPTAPRNPARVLLAEDDEEMRALLVQALRGEGHEVVECSDGFRLLEQLSSLLLSPQVMGLEPAPFDLIVSDIRMPGVTGLSVLEGLQLFEGLPPMILITAFGDEETHAAAQRGGAAAVFDKPFQVEDFLTKVREVASARP